MNTLMKVAAVAAVLIGPGASAQSGDELKVRDLMRACRLAENATGDVRMPTVDAFRAGYCLGIVAGLLSGSRMARAAELHGVQYPICLPDGVVNGDLTNVFVRWAEQHPEQWHRKEFVGLWQAVLAAFPCTE